MVRAYTGYLAANTLTGHTRAWLMGQGHCVAAIDSVNLLVGNLTPPDAGLTRYVRDFYSYAHNLPLGGRRIDQRTTMSQQAASTGSCAIYG
jgi:phosphoketolase